MPSEEELKKARDEERADGFGQFLDGDWWLGDHGKGEQTVLESGTVLRHHVKEECSGNCCLHGTSIHPSCRMPRQWRNDKQIIEHVCPHGIGHTCYAGVDYAISRGRSADGVHGCDGCCAKVDNRPTDPVSVLNEVDGYTLFQLSNDMEILSDAIADAETDIEDLRRTLNLRTLWLDAGLVFMAVAISIVAFR